jgi:predicted permease
VVPALRAAAVDPQDALRSGRGGGKGREHHFALNALVVMEISLSLILLIGAGLVLKGFMRLLNNDPGFGTAGLLVANVAVDPSQYPERNAEQRFLSPAIDVIRAIPGVTAAGAISAVPYLVWGVNSNVRYEGVAGDDPTRLPIAEQRAVSAGFFEVTGQRLIAGRLLQPSDETSTAAAVVVVNQALVDRDFPGRDPIGQRFHTSDTSFATIVGVVSDIRNNGPIQDPSAEMYWTYPQWNPGATSFPIMIRVDAGDPMSIAATVRQAIQRLDPTAAVGDLRAMPDVIASSLGRPRFYFSLLGSFAGVAIVLALAGLYGVLSYAVAQRTREMGIRAALGSSGPALMRLVASQGARLVVIGLAIGMVGGAAVTRLMEFMLYGVSPVDAATWAACASLMGAAAALAVFVPARRAARADPLVAIQAE